MPLELKRVIRVILSVATLLLLAGCNRPSASPFTLDPDKGIFRLQTEVLETGPCTMEINGLNAFRDSHLFQGSDSMVVINSCGGLDVISVFKEGLNGAGIRVRIVNPGDSTMEINSLSLCLLPGSGPEQLRAEQSPDADDLWHWLIEKQEGSLTISLELSGSSIPLLPEEQITLPVLQFFSHLCCD